ncbi:MAG: arylamine N-acetyltransferase [Myxococcota bacterium]
MNIDLSRWLKRVGLASAPPVSLDGLNALHSAQALAIPFENLDVLLGRRIRLEPEALMNKLIERRRGGYCFELNGLLQHVLEGLGFSVKPLIARVWFGRNPADGVRPRTHHVNLVSLGDVDWLVDVGFGSPTSRRPIRMDLGEVQDIEGERFRLASAGELGIMLEHEFPSGWRNLYSFTLDRAYPLDFELSNHYTATHPESGFRAGPRVARVLEDGRITMSSDEIVRSWRDGREEKRPTPRAAELIAVLEAEFGIALDEAPRW